MTSCSVCYENYSTDEENLIPRRLACGDVLCSSCIANDFLDEVFYCPECATEHKGSSVDDFSEVIGLDDIGSVDGTQGVDDSIITTMSSPTNNVTPRTICQVENCNNKSFAHGFCLHHSKHRKSSLVKSEEIADQMKHTSLRALKANGSVLQVQDAIADLRPEALMERFKLQERIDLGEAMELIDRAKDIMFRESNILNIDAPVVTVGDIHGQYYDLMNMLEVGGKPGEEKSYLFLGDYVDRGSFSCEVMFLLLALKVAYPTKIWLLRGNHESSSVSGHFGFKQECKMKYGMNVYYKFLILFQTMPLAAVISTAYGDIFACHGGLSPSFKTLDDINAIDRFVEPEADMGLLDILWSDPVLEENMEAMTDDEYDRFMNIDWKPNPTRGCSYAFGYKALREFLDKNNLVCVVRAHEVQEEGYKRHYNPKEMEKRIKVRIQRRKSTMGDLMLEPSLGTGMSPGKGGSSTPLNDDFMSLRNAQSDFPPLITIFSAPNYCDRYQNKAAILRIDMALNDLAVIQYECVEHPVPEMIESQTDNYILAIIAACPYMPTSFRNFVKMAVDMGPEEEATLVGLQDMVIGGDDSDSSTGQKQHSDASSVGSTTVEPSEASDEPGVDVEDGKLPGTPVAAAVGVAGAAGGDDKVVDHKPSLANSLRKSLRRSTGGRGPKKRRDSVSISLLSGPDNDDDAVAREDQQEEDDESRQGFVHDRRSSHVCFAGEPKEPAGAEGSSSNNSNSGGSNQALRVGRRASLSGVPDASGPHMSPAMQGSPSSPSGVTSSSAYVAAATGGAAAATVATPQSRDRRSVSLKGFFRAVDDDVLWAASASSTSGGSTAGPSATSTSTSGPSGDHRPDHSLSSESYAATSAPSSSSSSSDHLSHSTQDLLSFKSSLGSRPRRRMSRRGSMLKVNKNEAYMEAMYSDSINEIHPEKLSTFMQENPAHSPLRAMERQNDINLFKLAAEVPAISVADLKKRFEKSSAGPLSPMLPVEGSGSRGSSGGMQKRPSGFVAAPTDVQRLSAASSSIKREVDALVKTSRVAEFQRKFGGSVRRSTKFTAEEAASFVAPSVGGSDEGEGEGAGAGAEEGAGGRGGGVGTPVVSAPAPGDLLSTPSTDGHKAAIAACGPEEGTKEVEVARRKLQFESPTGKTKAPDDGEHESQVLVPTIDRERDNSSAEPDRGSTSSTGEQGGGQGGEEEGVEGAAQEEGESKAEGGGVLFSQMEILGLKLMFSLFDRSGSQFIVYDDLVAYAEETGDMAAIRDAATALEILDIDGDGKIGLLDFIHFAARLKTAHESRIGDDDSTSMTSDDEMLSGADKSPL